jgi:hypothetical protein
MKMADCPGCGKPLAKKSTKGRYYCETESCPVIFIQRPNNPAIRKIIYKPSVSEKAIRKIEQSPAHIH